MGPFNINGRGGEVAKLFTQLILEQPSLICKHHEGTDCICGQCSGLLRVRAFCSLNSRSVLNLLT